ncbi:aminopeptidase [Paraclostridium sordellii]|uniref:aminopeptidase n=1 Tax=Paraclostridium sordellii TaxID=1505 RepID=UPI000386DCDA|nr:aminopeptidase [Paeniclostridium sordellii]EPZ56004.1 aminopeptidase 2 [[Clostridium] sordellii VPI 9048] [Paeniclostridium sordellii VPI 9048]CEK38258.1 aminopeptidase [[Clostridium] sordellii] [Paeniclostridium sordellii]
MNFENKLNNYARLAVEIGANLQKNQILLLRAPIECKDFARKIVDIAYELGAKDVEIEWNDEETSLIRYLKASEDIFDEFPQWKIEKYKYLLEQGACIINIDSSNPTIFKDVDPIRMQKVSKSYNKSVPFWKEAIITDKIRWTIISVPSKAWACKVFNELDENEAIEKLWDYIFKCTRTDQVNPIEAWKKHNNKLNEKVEFLNKSNFKSLHFKSNKTDLHIELPKNHIWAGGISKDPNKIAFNANIPTEEVYTLPHKYKVNGIVSNTKPFVYNGTIIDDFTLTFKDGKIVDYDVKVGYDSLKSLLELDEGSCYLGEVALVENNSPISNTEIIYYSTLYDENASCHLALGSAYKTSIKDGDIISKEDMDKYGINDSIIHEDFMIGSNDLNITGITVDGIEIEIFKNGNWV